MVMEKDKVLNQLPSAKWSFYVFIRFSIIHHHHLIKFDIDINNDELLENHMKT
jgi:hypothetical protein